MKSSLTLGKISPTLVTLIKYSGFQDFEAVQSPAIVMLLHGWRQTVPGKKVTFFCFSNYMKFLSILTEGRGHIYRDPLRSQQGPRLRRLRRSLLLRRPQSGICGKDKSKEKTKESVQWKSLYKRKERTRCHGTHRKSFCSPFFALMPWVAVNL